MALDMGLVRGFITVVLLLLFIGICVHSWSRKKTSEFEAAASLPLQEDSIIDKERNT